jgi:hypothetical protein
MLIVGASVGGAPGVMQDRAESVKRVGLTGSAAEVMEECQGTPVEASGLLEVALLEVGEAKIGQIACLTGTATCLLIQRQSFLKAADCLLG